jgi:putative transposase
MRRSRFSEEPFIAVLREHDAGVRTADLCRKHGISDATFYSWKAGYRGMTVSEAARLRTLEDENRHRRPAIMLGHEGVRMNPKRVYRLYRRGEAHDAQAGRAQAGARHACAHDAAAGMPTSAGASTSRRMHWPAAGTSVC